MIFARLIVFMVAVDVFASFILPLKYFVFVTAPVIVTRPSSVPDTVSTPVTFLTVIGDWNWK